MKNWIGTYLTDTGEASTHDVQAPDFNAALAAFAALGIDGTLVSFAVDETTSPPILQSPNGTPWALAVDDDGQLTTIPAEGL